MIAVSSGDNCRNILSSYFYYHFLVLKPDGKNGWEIEHNKAFEHSGGTAHCNWTKNWQIVEFGPNRWGAMGETSDYYINMAWVSTIILTQNQNEIQESRIYTEFGSNVHDKDSQNEQDLNSLTASLTTDRSRVINGFYPLTAAVNGRKCGEKCENKTYQIIYGKEGYKAPKDYPVGFK